jgi:hypothetical protein
MGDRSINNKEPKKKKKSDATASAPSFSQRPIMVQPELIKKKKKEK